MKETDQEPKVAKISVTKTLSEKVNIKSAEN